MEEIERKGGGHTILQVTIGHATDLCFRHSGDLLGVENPILLQQIQLTG